MEHNLCSCGKSQVQPGDGSTIVVGTVGSLWLRLTVLPASKLPRSRKDKLGHEELSSLHTFGSSVSAKTDLAAATAFLFYGSLLLWHWPVRPIWLGQHAWCLDIRLVRPRMVAFVLIMGFLVDVTLGELRRLPCGKCSANDQFDCGRYSALMLFKLLPGHELFYVGYLTLLTPDVWFPLVIIEANKKRHMQFTLGWMGKMVL